MGNVNAENANRRGADESRHIDGRPLLRAGVCAGAVVKLRGDVLGSTVNTPARLSAVARHGQIAGNARPRPRFEERTVSR